MPTKNISKSLDGITMIIQTKDEPNHTLSILSLTIKPEESVKKHGIKNCLKFCLVKCLKNFSASKYDIIVTIYFVSINYLGLFLLIY